MATALLTPERPVLESLPDFGAARDDWRRLAPATDNIFSTWEWAELWWRHFGRRGSLSLARVRAQDGTIAVLPLYTGRRMGLRLTRFLGHGVADQLGPVCAPTKVAEVLSMLRAARTASLLLMERIPATSEWEAAGDVVLRAEASPVIALAAADDWQSYLAAHSPHFRQQVRRRARRVANAGVRFRLISHPAHLREALDALIALHMGRWGKRSQAFAGAREHFHREFAATALERGWLRLWLAEADGRAVSAWLGFRFAGVEYFYQSGRDRAWDHERVGAALLEHTIREAFADGMREYRLLRGDEPYKQRYASETRSVLTVVSARTPLARGSVAVVRTLAARRYGRRLLRAAAG